MNHQTFKVCILIDDNVENFYIKHYIDEINPIFNRFKNQVFNRNPGINTPNLKIYWIDSEEDKILVSCEEDFRLYIEQGKGRKIFFCSNTNEQQQQNAEEPSIEVIPMESEDAEHRCDRRCRKGHKDDEKRRRNVKKLTEKLKYYEDSVRNEEERQSRRPCDKRDHKNAERLEKAKRRAEQIKTMIMGAMDPANLNASFSSENSTTQAQAQGPSTSAAATPPSSNEIPTDIILSPETTRLISAAIAGCMQPCTVINKILNEVFAMIPQIVPLPEETSANAQASASTSNSSPATPSSTPTTNSEQQTIEIPRQTTATNTSDANTPVPVRQANDEIEALFKEAAKELKKMNEIVKNSNKMETSSTSSSMTGVTQIERIYPEINITDSVISNSTIINDSEFNEKEKETLQNDMTDSAVMVESPSKMGHSRESSIEVHDVGSIMSDDSRDWTILSIDQEESIEPASTSLATPSRVVDPKTGAIPKGKSVDNFSQVEVDEIASSESKRDSIKSVTTETQTAISILNDLQQQQLQASVQKSIDIVRKSIQSIQKSTESLNPQEEEKAKETKKVSIETPAPAVASPSSSPSYGFNQNVYPSLQPTVQTPAASSPVFSQANIKAKEPSHPKFAPAVIVYDPNPKINAAVHTMMQMGFTNEDNWLTQLLLNVDGDIPKALNFLTPQPKNKKQ